MTTLKYTDDDLKAAIAEVETKSKGLTWVSLNAVSRLLGKQRAAYLANCKREPPMIGIEDWL